MSDDSNQPSGPGPLDIALGRPRPGRWQVGLRTLFLLMAVVAVWMAVAINRQRSDILEARIATMRPLTRELLIDDPSKIAIVKLDDLWMDEDRWDVHVPIEGLHLCVATREVDVNGLAPAIKCVSLPKGRHRLELGLKRRGESWEIRVTSDGKEILLLEENKEWASSGHSTGGGDPYWISTQLPTKEPVILYRRRYHGDIGQGQTGNVTGPTKGLLLWIEPD